MGVRGLQTYINDFCPEVKTQVVIFDRANDHRKTFNVVPTLVVDGMAAVSSFYKSHNLEWIFGGQWIEYKNMLKEFTKKFKDNNIQLVFFFDGYVVPDKLAEWVNRRTSKCNILATVMDHIKLFKSLPHDAEFEIPTSLGTLSYLAIKVLCPEVKVLCTLNDADIEIANYARNNKDVFGILSNDTDFIIFDTKPYLSVRDLDHTTMTTVMYDRNRLSEHLSVSLEQLPLFSCLVGNDIMSWNDLKAFHFRLRTAVSNPAAISRPAIISQLIQKHQWKGNHFDEKELQVISHMICGNSNLKDKLSRGIAMYTEFHLPEQASCVVGLRHVDCTNLCDIFNVYKRHVFGTSEVLEDHRDKTLPPTNLAYRPLRKRCYGLIFSKEYTGLQRSQIFIKEWCAYYDNKMEAAEIVCPIFLPEFLNSPSMKDLWNQNNSVKLEHFLACLQSNITESILSTIEPKFAVLCCILNYLLTNFDSPLLKKFEIIAFIAQAIYIQNKTSKDISVIKGPSIESRAVHLCSLFARGISAVISLLGICGYPISCENAMPWNYFDGKIFHMMYGLSIKGIPPEALLKGEDPSQQLFRRLYTVAVYGVND